ncbi:hypothetical protein BIW11_07758 [Tropilaelaps mercedesae]|uniref:Probable RNA-binding protein 18 n=1 Tax=Tropilaelaps mercedesae TaxID=418985 RepID=A0A1V9XSR3_9ACAR|nr:hypothetical protein BIW11_07758 [Tropilaelaps mercedesae]
MDLFTPLPLPPTVEPAQDLRRLWVGNLDQRVTEFALLHILKPYGTVTQFDLLVHKTGPMKGLPRGYAFVTFETDKQAEQAVRSLDGQRLLERRLAVSYAHEAPAPQQGLGTGNTRLSTARPAVIASSSTVGLGLKSRSVSGDVNSQIRAIEAKLKAMKEHSESDLTRTLAATKDDHSLSIAQQINMAAGRDGRPGTLEHGSERWFCRKTRSSERLFKIFTAIPATR